MEVRIIPLGRMICNCKRIYAFWKIYKWSSKYGETRWCETRDETDSASVYKYDVERNLPISICIPCVCMY